jgi:hypothetical protein
LVAEQEIEAEVEADADTDAGAKAESSPLACEEKNIELILLDTLKCL